MKPKWAMLIATTDEDGKAAIAAAKKKSPPYQCNFILPDGEKNNWVWRVEYRIRYEDGTWSDWMVWQRRPNVFLTKRQAENRIKKIEFKDVVFKFEFAPKAVFVGYNAYNAWTNLTPFHKRCLERRWAELGKEEYDRRTT